MNAITAMRALSAASLLTVMLLTAPANARADAFDPLLSAVPSGATEVVAVDHKALRANPHYDGILRLLGSEGWGLTLTALDDAKIEAGKDFRRSVTFRMGGRAEGSILDGGLKPATLRKHFEKSLGKSFETGKFGAIAWFTVDGKLVAADLGEGRMVIAPKTIAEKVATVVGGKGKPVTRRSGFSGLRRVASKGNAPMWAVSWIPASMRKRLAKQGAADMAHVERTTWRVTGTRDVVVDVVGHTADPSKAKAVVDGIQGKIDRKVLGSPILMALGVGNLVKQLKLSVDGAAAVARMSLTEAQVGALARFGPKIIKVLK